MVSEVNDKRSHRHSGLGPESSEMAMKRVVQAGLRRSMSFVFVVLAITVFAGLTWAQSTRQTLPSAPSNLAGRGADQPFKLKIHESEKQVDFSAMANLKRSEAISEIRSLLPKIDDRRKSKLLFRLGELLWAQSRYQYSQEYEKFDRAYENWISQDRQGQEPSLQSFIKQSKMHKRQAVSTYESLLKEMQDYERRDEVLYVLSFTQSETGRIQDAISNFSDLIRQHPESKYAADAYLALGEYYFDHNDLSRAGQAYQKAADVGLERGRTSTFIYALYKLAWCDFNKREFETSLNRFKQVVDESEHALNRQQQQQKGRDAIQLKREALKDMVKVFAELGQVTGAYDYFVQKAGAQKAFELTDRLAATYKEYGKAIEEIDSFKLLIDLKPDSVEVARYRTKIMLAYANLSKFQGVLDEARAIAQICSSVDLEKSKGPVGDACAYAEQRIRQKVTSFHRFAQKQKHKTDYEVAQKIYEHYFFGFPANADIYRLKFFYAELLWDQGRWEAAADIYGKVIAIDENGEYSINAAQNAVLAWENVIKEKRRPHFVAGRLILPKKSRHSKNSLVAFLTKENDQSLEPKPIVVAQKKLVEALDVFVKLAERRTDLKLAKEIPHCKFKAAYIYQANRHFDKAQKRFDELIEKWPDSKLARQGAMLVLDSFDARKDWPKLEQMAFAYLQIKALASDKKFASKTQKFHEGAAFNNVSAAHKKARLAKDSKKQLLRVANRFKLFESRFAKSAFAATALFNASAIYDEIEHLDLAISAAKALLGRHKKALKVGALGKEEAYAKTLMLLASAHEKIADYQHAAKWYERAAADLPKHKLAPDMLFNAGVLREALGQYTESIRAFERYRKRYQKRKDKTDTILRLAHLYEKNGSAKKANRYYALFAKKMTNKKNHKARMKALYSIATNQYQKGENAAGAATCKAILSQTKHVAEIKDSANEVRLSRSYCTYQLLERDFRAYLKINAKVPFRKLKKRIAYKQKKMKTVAKKNLDILSIGHGEYGIAGLLRAAQVQLNYVDALRAVSDPPRLNAEARDLFRSELENIIFPVEEQAIVALEEALKTAFALSIYSSHTVSLKKELNKFVSVGTVVTRDLPFFNDSIATDIRRPV